MCIINNHNMYYITIITKYFNDLYYSTFINTFLESYNVDYIFIGIGALLLLIAFIVFIFQGNNKGKCILYLNKYIYILCWIVRRYNEVLYLPVLFDLTISIRGFYN